MVQFFHRSCIISASPTWVSQVLQSFSDLIKFRELRNALSDIPQVTHDIHYLKDVITDLKLNLLRHSLPLKSHLTP